MYMLKNDNEKKKKILLSQYPVVPLLLWCDVNRSVHLIWAVPLSCSVLGCVISNWLLVWHTLLNLYFHYIDTALQQIWVKVIFWPS